MSQVADQLNEIAVVGMPGRFPDAPSIEQLGKTLCAGVVPVVAFRHEQILSVGVKSNLAGRRTQRSSKVEAAGLAFLLFLVTSLTLQSQTTSTNIAIGSTVIQPGVKHLGINLATHNYWDSGQMMQNLVLENPGFEGEIYQSIIECASGSVTTCVDSDLYSAWPAGFWNGATFEFFYGAANGLTGTVSNYTAATSSQG